MNHLFHHLDNIFDFKMALSGAIFFLISVSDLAEWIKIIGGVILIAYYIRRWVLMEKNNKLKKTQDED
jgi:hypothetical protein